MFSSQPVVHHLVHVGGPTQFLNVVVADLSLPGHRREEGELLHVGQGLADNPGQGNDEDKNSLS